MIFATYAYAIYSNNLATSVDVRSHIGGDSIEARRHVPPHFLELEACNGACLPIFWTDIENIGHAHIEPCPQDRQNIFYICFVSSHDSILK